jgi:dTDP-4-dehydrorhamnose reductase
VRVLLTGAEGQLGRALVPELEARQHEVVALSHAQLDITDEGAVGDAAQSHRPGLVINAAAYNAVDRAETDRDTAFRINAEGPRLLAMAAASVGAAILHVSTDYVFDGEKRTAYTEDDVPNPQSVYGQSKLAGEEAVRKANPLRHAIVRTAWVYAHGGKNFPLTILELAKKGPVRVVDDQFGSPTYAPHLAWGIARLIETQAHGATWHLAGGGEGTSWYGLTVELFRLCGIETPVTPVTTAAFPRPARRPRQAALTSVRQDPPILLPPWKEGLRAFAEGLAV